LELIDLRCLDRWFQLHALISEPDFITVHYKGNKLIFDVALVTAASTFENARGALVKWINRWTRDGGDRGSNLSPYTSVAKSRGVPSHSSPQVDEPVPASARDASP
jgi:hypothetical protein